MIKTINTTRKTILMTVAMLLAFIGAHAQSCSPDVTPPTITCSAPVTINNTTGLCTGTTTLTAPAVSDNCLGGNALRFDGINDYVSIPHTAAFDMVDAITLEAWVNVAAGGDLGIFGRSNNSSYNIGIYSGSIYFQTDGGWDLIFSFPYINSWTHVAVTYDRNAAANQMKGYVNGVLVASIAKTDAIQVNNSIIQIGSYWVQYRFNGRIDEARIWNVARTQSEIQANMNNELNSGTGLVAAYHFNQGVAGGNNAGVTSAIDASGNNHTGTLTNFTLNGSTSNWVGGVPNISSNFITNNAPATYPVGNTTVTWTATDASGNTATCNQTVTVVSQAQEIDVQGGSPLVSIVDGDVTPVLTDHTDFGNVTLVRTFTVQNTGSAPLTVSSVSVTGGDASQFTVGSLTPTSPIPAGNSATFTVTFTATSLGTKTTTVQITNNDCDEATYDFAIQGASCASIAPTSISGTSAICNGSSINLTAVGGTLGTGANYQWGTGNVVGTSPISGATSISYTATPSGSTNYWVRIENTTSPCTANTSGVVQLVTMTGSIINLQGNSNDIVSGSVTTSASNATNFGGVKLIHSVSKTYTIKNLGSSTLNLGAIAVGGSNPGDFVVTSAPASSVAPCGSTTFTVKFQPLALGVRSAELSIANDASSNNPYTFAVSGSGIVRPYVTPSN